MVEILAYADDQGRITHSTLLHAPLYAPRRTPMALGIALALADAAGRVYAVWDEGKHPRDEDGKWATKSVPGADGTVPAEPGTTSIPDGYVRLYHQTDEQSLMDIAKSGLKLEYAKGLEGPKAVYAGEMPFYGSADSRPTLEFFVPKNKWSSPFVLQDVFPQNMIAIHLPWHSKARYLENNPDSLKQALAGEFDSLTSDYAPAVAYVKQKYGVKTFVANYAISRPLYVSRPVENADEIIAWAKSQGIETMLPPEDMHVTVCYSRDAVDWQLFTHMNDTLELPASGVRELAIEEAKSDFPNRIVWQEDDLEAIKDYADDSMTPSMAKAIADTILLNQEERWITVNGRHVHIKDGEDVTQALKRSDDRKRLDGARSSNGVEASRALAGTFKYPPPELTVENRQALRKYISDGSLINDKLRGASEFMRPDIGGGRVPETAIGQAVIGLDQVFEALPATTTDLTVLRGISTSRAEALGFGVGAVVKDAGYVSTTVSEKVAGEFGSKYSLKDKKYIDPVLVEIKVPAGSKVLSIPSLHIAGVMFSDREAELLLPRGSKFRITSVKGNRVQAELLPQGQYAEYHLPGGHDQDSHGNDDGSGSGVKDTIEWNKKQIHWRVSYEVDGVPKTRDMYSENVDQVKHKVSRYHPESKITKLKMSIVGKAGSSSYADTTLTRLGDKGAVVLKFESPQLAERHSYFRELGASWDYEEYTPHITLSYTVPDGFDLDAVQPYTGRIVLGPEEFEELDTDWGDKVKEHSQQDPIAIDYAQIKKDLDSLEGKFRDELRELLTQSRNALMATVRRRGAQLEDVGRTLELPYAKDIENAIAEALQRAMDRGGADARKETLPLVKDFAFDPNQPRDDHGRWSDTHILGSAIARGDSEYAKDSEIAFPAARGVPVPLLGKDQIYLVRYTKTDEVNAGEGVGHFAYAGKNIDDVVNATQSYAKDTKDGFLILGRTKDPEWDQDRFAESDGVEYNGVLGKKDAPVDLVINLSSGKVIKYYSADGIAEGKWITTRGRKVFIKEGETLEQALGGHGDDNLSISDDWQQQQFLSNENQTKLKTEADKILSSFGFDKDRVPFGQCAVTCTKLWDVLGQPKDVVPTSVMIGEDEHVILVNQKKGWALDPTGRQYDEPFYHQFVKDQTKTPYKSFKRLSKQELNDMRTEAAAIVEKAKKKYAEYAISFTPNAAIKWLKAKIFWVSDVLSGGLLNDIRLILINGLKTGKLNDEIVTDIANAYVPYLGDPAAVKTPGAALPTAARLETVVRTNITEAYNRGRLADYIKPKMMPFLDGIRYSAILDSRTTPVCNFLHSKIFKPTDPALDGLVPPNHFNALAEGTLILTEDGLVPIQDVCIGQKVFTHKGRWREVYATMKKRSDTGKIKKITLSSGQILLATDEHPVLTLNGWQPAGNLNVGDYLFQLCEDGLGEGSHTLVRPEDYPALFDEPPVPYEIIGFSRRFSVPAMVYFEDDFSACEGKVNNVSANSELVGVRYPAVTEDSIEHPFVDGGSFFTPCNGKRFVSFSQDARHSSGVSSFHEGADFRTFNAPCPVLLPRSFSNNFREPIGDSDLFFFRPDSNVMASAPAIQDGAGKTQLSFNSTDRFILSEMFCSNQILDDGFVSKVKHTNSFNWETPTIITIVDVEEQRPVYNLAVREDQSYHAEGIIVHNCRSLIVPVVVGENIPDTAWITPAEIEQARGLADVKFLSQDDDLRIYYDPDQPRDGHGRWSDSGMLIAQEDFTSPGEDSTETVREGAAKRLAKVWKVEDSDLQELMREEIGNNYYDSLSGESLREAAAEALLRKWGGSSGGPIVVAGSTAVANRLGQPFKLYPDEESTQDWMRAHPAHQRAASSFGLAMYDNTQQWLKDKGISRVTVMRSGDEASERPFSSWSTHWGGVRHESGRPVIKTTVDAKYVWSVPSTGFGTLAESEVVLLARPRTALKPFTVTEDYDQDDEGNDGKWITVKGRHVFIKEGESLQDALGKQTDFIDSSVGSRQRISDRIYSKLSPKEQEVVFNYAGIGNDIGEKDLTILQDIFDKHAVSLPEMEVFRAEGESFGRKLVPGNVFTGRGFTSVSGSEKGLSIIKEGELENGVEGSSYLRIGVPAGSKALPMTGRWNVHFRDQDEILFPKGSQFKVTARTGDNVSAVLLPKEEQKKTYDQDDEGHEGKWVTVRGRAIFIRKDEDMESALTRSLLKKGSERPKADEEDKTLAGLLAGNASRLKGEQKKKGLFGRMFTEDGKPKPRPRIMPRMVKK